MDSTFPDREGKKFTLLVKYCKCGDGIKISDNNFKADYNSKTNSREKGLCMRKRTVLVMTMTEAERGTGSVAAIGEYCCCWCCSYQPVKCQYIAVCRACSYSSTG
jgi:hypothetical protein